MTMMDSVYNLFEGATDEFKYLQPLPSTFNVYEVYYPGYYHIFEIDVDA